jgi:hypothetical protein
VIPRRLYTLFPCAALLAGAAHAQISQATLQGVVKDSGGAVIPSAAVSLKNKGTDDTRSTLTDPTGAYIIPNLAPAEYSLTVSFRGFKTYNVSTLTLHTGESATLDVALEVGETSQEVNVEAAVPLLSTASAEVSHLVPPAQVDQLPLNGRNFWELTQLTPGAGFIQRPQAASFNGSEIRARNVNVTVNGQSSIFTGWALDGANITNFELGGALITPNVDAIQEFSVAAGNMDPEYGHTPNMINASIKSGTNSFHGSLFEFLRNDKFDARNFFLPHTIPLKRNQFGFAAGGPIVHDRVFFFADFEGTRMRQGTPFNYIVPSTQERGGNFSDVKTPILDPLTKAPFPGNIIPAARISQQGAFFTPFIPAPNLLQGTTSRYIYPAGLPLDNNEGDMRVDAHLTAKDVFMARYSVSSNTELNPNPFPTLGDTNLHSKAQDSTMRWTRIFGPSLLNVAQAAYYDSPFIFGTVLPNHCINQEAGIVGFSDPVIVPDPCSMPTINITGYQQFQGSTSDGRPKYIRVRTLQLSDTMSYTHGRHEMKFGMEWLHLNAGFHVGQNSVGVWNFVGTYSGNAYADLLLGYPDSGTRGPAQTLQGDYDDFKAWHFNDSWRVRPGLTVTLGARWEINPFYKGINLTRSGFDGTTGKVIVPEGLQNLPTAQPMVPILLPLFADRFEYSNQVGLPPSISPSDHRDVSPRVGIAWTPRGSQKTVIRAGYGIFFALPDSNLMNHTVVTAPFAENQTLFNDRPPAIPTRTWANFYQGAPIASPNPHPGQPCPFGFVALSCDTPNLGSALIYLRNQYTQQWNFSVQREITSRVAVTVAYVGNRTSRLQAALRNNDPNPGPGAIQPRRPYSQWGPDTFAQWGGKADYHGLQNQIEVRDWNGLTMMGSYVWSKCMDSGTDESGPYTSQLIGKDYAPCTFDATHTGSISFSYELPFGKGKQFLSGAPGVMNQVVGGFRR